MINASPAHLSPKQVAYVIVGFAILLALVVSVQLRLESRAESASAIEDVDRIDQARLVNAREHVSSLFRKANPHATIQWATYETGFLPDKTAILVRFQYSVKNALGGTAVHQKTVKVSSDLTQVLAEDDKFLHFQ